MVKTNIDRSKLTDKIESTGTGDPKGDKFLRELQKYAKRNGLRITNIKSWTIPKIIWMAHNDKKCACDPDNRHCPCQLGLEEINKRGKCKCSVFEKA